MITLEIDGKRVQAEVGQTILEAAQAAGIRIPTLCHLPGLSPRGSCRICLVEVTNWNGKLVPAYASHAKYVYEPNRCVLCGRCVRACSEVEGAMTWGFSGRGVYTLVEADLGGPWGDSETCTECGKCVQACPTGALVERGKATAEQEKRPQLLVEVTERRPRV